MPVKPLDMQVLLPKLHKNDLLKPRIIHKVENEQQVMQNAAQQDTDEKLKKVNTFERKEVNKIKNDEEQRQKEQQEAGKRNMEEKEDTQKDKKEKKETEKKYKHIDIKV